LEGYSYSILQAKTPALSFNNTYNTDTITMGKNKDTEVDKVAGIATDDDVGKLGIQLGHMMAGWGVRPRSWIL
jgi:hypothetical protein